MSLSCFPHVDLDLDLDVLVLDALLRASQRL